MPEFDPDNPRDKDEAEAIEMTREAAVVVEDAIFQTMLAANVAADFDNHSSREIRVARVASKDAWKAVADKLMAFAVHND